LLRKGVVHRNDNKLIEHILELQDELSKQKYNRARQRKNKKRIEAPIVIGNTSHAELDHRAKSILQNILSLYGRLLLATENAFSAISTDQDI